LLPDWTWEAYRKEEDGVYFGRVRSPNTRGDWEYGYFTQNQLEEAGAYRIDTEIDTGEELFPDGGHHLLSQLYETELEALLQEEVDN
jgi:hypothetical protein